ncbi:ABC-2 type transport system permease protein [Paenibacillus phyllosphaerae]|uniref:ABC-2 type transport system permease protein n=1 Tax=Paenibacillus phyllosphaerae TaxID=274593 RepID=A0A7W5B4C5_9BACL|nr:ABC-2 family transporter protein [Paenibacillus phyllosphaerae]MBB3114185.1 ABC-2 type transport system permease protein [Paenibacillus phyllosphaerae]
MKAWHKYRRTYMLAFQNAMEYRADFLLSIISGSFIVIVQCFLWTAVFSSSPNDVINGYTYSQMIIYSVLSGVVSKLVSAGFEGEIANDIKTGGLSKFIAQPINYFWYRICSFFGGKTVQMGIVLLMLVVMMIIFAQMWEIQFGVMRTVFFLASIVFGLLINFLLFYSISALAFVVTEVWGVFIAFSQGVYMLSGAVFPLNIFGDAATGVFSLLPFQYIVFFPVNIINGNLASDAIVSGLMIQAGWVIALIFIAKLCWASGMRKYVAVGG